MRRSKRRMCTVTSSDYGTHQLTNGWSQPERRVARRGALQIGAGKSAAEFQRGPRGDSQRGGGDRGSRAGESAGTRAAESTDRECAADARSGATGIEIDVTSTRNGGRGEHDGRGCNKNRASTGDSTGASIGDSTCGRAIQIHPGPLGSPDVEPVTN